MTRKEAEHKIQAKTREIAEILKAYNPDSNYFTLYMRIKENWVNGNNEYWSGGEDENKPINFYGQLYEEDK